MAEVPDLVHCLPSDTSITSFGQIADQTSFNGENLPMVSDDNLPAIPIASASIENTITSIAPSDAAAEVEYNFEENVPLLKRIESLKQQELLVLRNNFSGFYSALVAYYFASFDWQKIRTCRMRIEALFTRSDKQLIILTKIARNLEERRFGTALRLCKEWDCRTNSSRALMLEVQERLLLYIMLLVQHSYSSIEIKRLAEMLDVPPASLPQMINKFGWSINTEFVYPIMSEKFVKILEERQNSSFGGITLNGFNGSISNHSCGSFDEELECLANFVASMET